MAVLSNQSFFKARKHGDGYGLTNPTRCLVRSEKIRMTNFIMLSNSCSMIHALKLVPGLANVGVPHGDGDGRVAPAPGSGSKNCAYHVDQHEKLNGWDVQYLA